MNIGQFRRNQVASYTTKLSYRQGLLVNENSAINFYDQCLFLSGVNAISSLNSYYLKFRVKQSLQSVQDFTLKLKSDDVYSEEVQSIKDFNVKQGEDYTTFELIFNPNMSYNQIVFELKRLALDYNTNNGDGTSGRIMNIEIIEFSRVVNIISDYLAKKYEGLTTLKKIGIQGPPGMLFALDGEEIRLGRSGMYELYNDNINISYIGFIINDALFTQDGKDFFIMDFKY